MAGRPVNEWGCAALQIAIRMDTQCKVVCMLKSLNKVQTKAFKKKIDDEYRVNMCGASWVASYSIDTILHWMLESASLVHDDCGFISQTLYHAND